MRGNRQLRPTADSLAAHFGQLSRRPGGLAVRTHETTASRRAKVDPHSGAALSEPTAADLGEISKFPVDSTDAIAVAESKASESESIATSSVESANEGRAPTAAGESDSPEQKLRRLEAVLLISRQPLPSRKLSELAGLADGTEARTLVKRLNRGYVAVGGAFRAEEIAGGFQLLTRPAIAPWLRRYAGEQESADSLSSPSLETLAVVAYKQPVTRADVEAIRGVRCGEILRQLQEKELIRISGRSEELGRPYLYSTTRRFMQIFGLQSLDYLPKVETVVNVDPQDPAAPTEVSGGVGGAEPNRIAANRIER